MKNNDLLNSGPISVQLRSGFGQLRSDFGPASVRFRSGFGPASVWLWTGCFSTARWLHFGPAPVNFGPVTVRFRSGFGQLRSIFVANMDQLRSNFGPVSVPFCGGCFNTPRGLASLMSCLVHGRLQGFSPLPNGCLFDWIYFINN